MTSFSLFMELSGEGGSSEEKRDIFNTLRKIPNSHSNLVKGFQWKFHSGNTLNGDSQHVGYMDTKEKEIAVAAPWNYGREFTILHEIAHRVWDRLPEQIKIQWNSIVANTKDKQNQSVDELFCMAYANHYAKNRMVVHDHPEWHEFIKNLPQ